MNFGVNELKAIYGMVVGWGTEVLPSENPYKIDVVAEGGWGGKVKDNSGYAMGVIQFDFGAQGSTYSSQLVSMANQWGQTRLISFFLGDIAAPAPFPERLPWHAFPGS